MAKRKRTSPWSDPGTAYALAVVNGEVVTGRLVKLAAERHLRDLGRWHPAPDAPHDPKYRYAPELGARVERFAALLKHFEGRWVGEPIRFDPWQQFSVYSVFGWQTLNERGRWVRRFRKAYKQVGRKNGKTTECAAIGDYLFIGDGEAGSQVFTIATKLKQARIMHTAAMQALRGSSFVKGGHVKIVKDNMYSAAVASKYEPLASDSETEDGLNPHGGLIDEYHEHPDSSMYDVINTAMGARDQPVLWIITTAGKKLDSACGRERAYAIKVLEGHHTDERFFAYIAEMDEGDDPADERNWGKANPSLGTIISLSDLRDEYNKAKEDPAQYGDFMRKRLNMWLESEDSWLAFDATERWWKTCAGPLPLDQLAGRICYGGLDLSTVIDLSAFALIFPPGDDLDRWALLLRLWCPEQGVIDRSRKDRVPYDMWVRNGWMKATEGNEVDYEKIETDILELGDRYKIQSIGYDKWNATATTQALAKKGMNLFEMQQNFRDLSQPMKRLEGLIKDCNLLHGDALPFRWALSNVVVRRDENDNIAPNKKKARERIDPVSATVMALGRATREDGPARSRYEEEDAEVVSFSL